MAGVTIFPDTQTGALATAIVNSSSSAIAAPAGVQGKIIKVYRLFLVVGAATTITFEDGSNPVSGPISLLASEAIVFDIDGSPWFTTSSGNAFTIGNSGGVQIGGNVYYMLAQG